MWISRGYLIEYYIDPNTGVRKRISVKLSSNSDKAKQDAIKRLTDKLERIQDKRILLSECVALWLKEGERAIKPSTYRKYRITFESIIKIISDAYMDRITAGYVRQKFIDSGEENRTLNGYLKVFKTFWRWAYRSDFVKSPEVADKLQAFQDTPKKERIQDKYLEPAELSKLLDSMKETRWKLVSECLALSGLRVGELAALTRSDVSSDYIHVTKTYDANNKVVTSAKTYSSKRDVYIQDELKECISRINEYTKWQAEVCGYESAIFFPDVDGGRLHYYAFSKYLKETSERVLQKRVTPHVLRHSHCSMLALAGFPLEAISVRLGHSDSRITKEIYLHRMKELKERENNQLDAIHLIE